MRGAASLLIWLASLALVLTSLGLYAVLAFGVTQRRRELAIRMAVGASHVRVAGAVVGRGAALAAVGTVIGLAGAFVATRALTSLMYGVQPNDPVMMAMVAAVLAVVALAAAYLPARRASRVDPIIALQIGVTHRPIWSSDYQPIGLSIYRPSVIGIGYRPSVYRPSVDRIAAIDHPDSAMRR